MGQSPRQYPAGRAPEAHLDKLNPNAVVPTMLHDGKVILNSSVMCEYLDEVFPGPA